MLRNINISPVLNGFTVSVGCQVLAYTSVDKLITDLGNYLRDPEGTEKRIVETEGINARHTGVLSDQAPERAQNEASQPVAQTSGLIGSANRRSTALGGGDKQTANGIGY